MIEAAFRSGAGFMLGVATGSFMTNWALRFASEQGALSGRSRCEICRSPFTFAQLTPLISFAVLRGRCQRCGLAIDPIHPIGALGGGLVGLFAVLAATPIEAALRAILGLSLLAVSVIDSKILRVPDGFSVIVALACADLAFLHGRLWEGAIAAAVTLVLLVIVRRAKRLEGVPGLGLGDVKLACGLALWLGAMTSWMFVAASIMALVAIGGQIHPVRPRPFGPWLAIGALLVGSSRELSGWTGLS